MNANPPFTNKLIHESSPYLLQHAHNPVDWIAWSAEVFHLAKKQNKPILLSIGYAACHWCHVMERESFESEEVAIYMNTHFINVKVDREERPDVDHIYMDALQAMTGAGGWPLNIFLLPNGKPFFGGTYFPPIAMHQRASWMEVLKSVQEAYVHQPEKLIEQSENLTNHIAQTGKALLNSHVSIDNLNEPLATKEELILIGNRILQNADTQWGGFGTAPKFPQTFSIQMLFRNFYINHHEASMVHGVRSLDKMIQGGIYDHLGGGFSRYSTDVQWQAPHFEKMLYDNALLLTVLAEAYQITKKENYKMVIEDTIQFLDRELSNEAGGYFAALDADSEGVEGKYYTWTYEEIKAHIDSKIFEDFCSYYQIKEEGNWEHTNILWTQNSMEEGSIVTFQKARKILFTERGKKIRPALDYKIILSWNNLMVIALCKCYGALGEEKFKNKAIATMQWLELNLYNESENYFYHTNTKGNKKAYAFLEDYATLIQAYIQLQIITGETNYLEKAKLWTEYVQIHFLDEESIFYYYTAAYQKDIIIRKKELYDGAQPSANAVMCTNLIYLGSVFDQTIWVRQAEQMISHMKKMMLQYPNSYSYWAQSFSQLAAGCTELVSVGSHITKDIPLVLAKFLPCHLILFTETEVENIVMTIGKQTIDNQYFICKNNTCSEPIGHLNEFLAII